MRALADRRGRSFSLMGLSAGRTRMESVGKAALFSEADARGFTHSELKSARYNKPLVIAVHAAVGILMSQITTSHTRVPPLCAL